MTHDGGNDGQRRTRRGQWVRPWGVALTAGAVAVAFALLVSACTQSSPSIPPGGSFGSVLTQHSPPVVATTGSGAPAPTPSPKPTLAELTPAGGVGEGVPEGKVLAQEPHAIGPKRLAEFTPTQSTLYVTFACLGPGKIALGHLFDMSPCDGSSGTIGLKDQKGVRERLTFNVSPTTEWRLLIQDGIK